MDARSGGGRVSSLRDDLNSRAYASELPGYGAERAPAGEPVEECAACHTDGVEIVDGYCNVCHWTPEETCEAWSDRLRWTRVHCACTARYDAPGAYACGYCKAHGIAWHTKESR